MTTDRSDKKMKTRLLHILWDGGLGGLERCVLEFTRHVDLHRYNVTIALLNRSGPMTDQIDRNKIHILEFGFSSSLDIKAFLRFLHFIRLNRFDIIHNHIRGFLMNVALLALNPRPVLICHNHGLELQGGKGRVIKTQLFYAVFGRVYDVFIAVHNEMAQIMKHNKILADKIVVIENPVDVFFFIPANESELNSKNNRNYQIIGTVSRLVPQKDFNLFVDTARLIIERFSDVRVVIVGDGPLREKLQTSLKKPEFKGRIMLAGGIVNVPKFLKTIDLFLFTSRVEPFGMTLIESLACGVPVLAALPEKGGAIDLLETLPGGTLVKKREPEALADAAITLLKNPENMYKLGRMGREYVVKHYATEIWIDALDGLYQQLLDFKAHRD